MSDPTCGSLAWAGECIGQWRCSGSLGCIFGVAPDKAGAPPRAPEAVQGVSEYPDGTNGALAGRPASAIGYGDAP